MTTPMTETQVVAVMMSATLEARQRLLPLLPPNIFHDRNYARQFYKITEALQTLPDGHSLTDLARLSSADVSFLLNIQSEGPGLVPLSGALKNLLSTRISDCSKSGSDPMPFAQAITAVAVEAEAMASHNTDTDSDSSLFPETTFPWEALPAPFTDMVKRMATAMQVEPEVVACIALTILSGVIGNSVRVSPKKGWYTPLFLWLAFLGESGYGKTHPLEALGAYLKSKQKAAYDRHESSTADYNKEMADYKNTPPKSRGELPEPPPAMVHYYAENFTSETFIDFFKSNDRGIVFLLDEIGKLLLSFDQYRHGKGNDRQVMLELFNCGALKVDRKSGTSFCPHSGAAIVGGIQPAKMAKIFTDDGFEDGLITRFLTLHTSPREIVFTEDGVEDDLISQWESLLDYGDNIPLLDKPALLKFQKDALRDWADYHDRLHRDKLLMSTRGRVFVPKLITYSLKFAGLLHVLVHAYKGTSPANIVGELIDRQTTVGAISLTEFFAGQAVRTISLYGGDGAVASDGRLVRLTSILAGLHSQVKNGKLPVGGVIESYNEGLPSSLHLPNHGRTLSVMLKSLGLTTVKSTGGERFVDCTTADFENLLQSKTTKTTKTTNTTNTTDADSGFSGFSGFKNPSENDFSDADSGFSGFSGFSVVKKNTENDFSDADEIPDFDF